VLVTPGYTAADEISFAPDVLDPVVTIRGLNFGNERGRVKLESEHDCVDPIVVSPYPDLVSWTDTQISFRLDQTRFPPDTWTIEIIRDDKDADLRAVRSVGRFRLDVRKAVFTDLDQAGGPLPVDVGGQPFRSSHPFCTGGDVLFHQIVDCTGLSGPQMLACGASGGAGTVMWTGPAPMADFLPGPYAEHRYSVIATGECGSLGFPAEHDQRARVEGPRVRQHAAGEVGMVPVEQDHVGPGQRAEGLDGDVEALGERGVG
jgi:hypothetical protein